MNTTLADCKRMATMLSLATRRTYYVRRAGDGAGVELLELCARTVRPRLREDAAFGSVREMHAYLAGRIDGAQMSAGALFADALVEAACLLGPDQEREVMELPYRELGANAIVHEPEDDPTAPCRSYVVAVDTPEDVLFVGVIAAPAPTPAPTIAELERVALAVVMNR